MFQCMVCGRRAALILNVCSRCDPKLHQSHEAALKSSIDFDMVTPEIERSFSLLQSRKAAQHRLHLTAFGVGMQRYFARISNFIRYRLAIVGGG